MIYQGDKTKLNKTKKVKNKKKKKKKQQKTKKKKSKEAKTNNNKKKKKHPKQTAEYCFPFHEDSRRKISNLFS